jgi:hypothetical protein
MSWKTTNFSSRENTRRYENFITFKDPETSYPFILDKLIQFFIQYFNCNGYRSKWYDRSNNFLLKKNSFGINQKLFLLCP